MPLSITHTAQTVVADDGTSPVGSNEWNAEHTLSGVMAAANLPAASTTAQGVVELATDAERETGTDTTRALTPSNLGGVWPTDSFATVNNQLGVAFGSADCEYSYLIMGKLIIVQGRATITTLAPNAATDQVAIPLPRASLMDGSFTCRNTALGRIGDGRLIATSGVALIYDSQNTIGNGHYLDFTMVYHAAP